TSSRATTSSSTSSSDHSAGNAGTSGDPSQPQPVSNADQNSGGANGQCTGATYCSTRDGSPSMNGNGGGKATGKPCAGCVGKADNKNPPGQEKTDPYGTFPNNGYECDHNNGIGKTNPAHTGCTTSGGTTDCTTNPTAPGCSGGGTDCSTNPTAPECSGGGTDCSTNPTAPECSGGGTDCTSNPSAPECSGGGTDCTSNPSAPDCSGGGTDCSTNPDAADCSGDTGCPAGATDCTPPSCVPTEANGFCSTVLGEHQSRTPNTPGTPSTTNVLGEKVTRTPGALPFTGAEGIGLMLGTAALAMTVGGGLMLASRRRRGELG
ncbi:MAG TPA: hypothetical protein VFH66_15060, partial [Mycobacteriales bacterium]|nr:hypothetical protein [Mycobacteriales bacterium]